MTENEIAAEIVDAAFAIHTRLGPGLLESVYEAVLSHELKRRGLRVQRQVGMPLEFDGAVFNVAYRVDLIVEDAVFIELKSTEEIHPAHLKQLLTYLRLGQRRLGLLLNFGADRMKRGVRRIANGLPDT